MNAGVGVIRKHWAEPQGRSRTLPGFLSIWTELDAQTEASLLSWRGAGVLRGCLRGCMKEGRGGNSLAQHPEDVSASG